MASTAKIMSGQITTDTLYEVKYLTSLEHNCTSTQRYEIFLSPRGHGMTVAMVKLSMTRRFWTELKVANRHFSNN